MAFWTYEIIVYGNAYNLRANASTSLEKTKIRRTYPAESVDTTNYRLKGTSGKVSSNKCLVTYVDPSNPKQQFGDYGTTDVLAKNSTPHAITDVAINGISSSLINVGLVETGIALTARCTNSSITTNVQGFYNDTTTGDRPTFTLTVEVEELAVRSTASVPDRVSFPDPFTVTVNNPTPALVTNTVYMKIGTTQVSGTKNTNGTYTIKTDGIGSQFASTTYVVGTVYVTSTKSDGTKFEDYTSNITISVTSDTAPTIADSDVVFSIPTDSDKTKNYYATVNQIFVQGLTGMKITVTATAKSGASISSYSFSSTAGSFTANENTYFTNAVTVSGNITFTIKATDSRGQSVTKTVTKYVYPYTKPSISNVTAYRSYYSGVAADEDGTYARVKASVAGTDYVYNKYNTITLKCYYYRATSSSIQLEGETTQTSDVYATIGNGELNPQYQYYVRFIASDSISDETTTQDVDVSTTTFAMHIHNGGTGIAFGQVSSKENAVEINNRWTPYWGNYIMPRIVCQKTRPVNPVVGLIWLEPKN